MFCLCSAVYLIDLSNTSLEDAAPTDPKTIRGYSRNHCQDCNQPVIDGDGLPQGHKVFRGILRDSTSPADMPTKPGGTRLTARRLSYVRVFARYRKAADPRTEVPSPGLLPFQPKRAKPYLYSDEEIRNLLRAALGKSYYSERCAMQPRIYYCLFGLLSVSGLRLGEVRNLELREAGSMPRISTALFTRFRARPACVARTTVMDRASMI